MPNNKPKVSVIIPTYNRSNVLPRAIDSVLNQKYDHVEIIVVDDGSDDNTSEIINKYRKSIEYIQFKKNRGANAARNAGIKYSTGEYIAFLDSDDELPPDNISEKVQVLEKSSKSIGGVFTPHKTYKNDQLWMTGKCDKEEVDIETLRHSNVVGGFSCVAVRRSVFDDIGFLDESLPSSQDYDFYIRLTQKYKLRHVDSTHVIRYAGANRIGFDLERKVEGHTKILEKHGNVLSPKRKARQYSSLGILFSRVGDSTLARRHFRQAISENQTEWRAYPLYFVSHFGDNNLRSCVEYLDKLKGLISKIANI